MIKTDENIRVCEKCGEPFARPRREAVARFSVRRFCSKSCQANARRRMPQGDFYRVEGPENSAKNAMENSVNRA